MPADRSANQSYQSNHTDDTNQWPTPEAWWETALNITGRVAEMVGPFVPMVLGMLAAPKQAADEPFRITGPVQWYLAQSEGSTPRIFVKNTGRNEVALSFTGANQETGHSSTQLVALGPATNGSPDAAVHDITSIISDFMLEAIPNPYVAMVTADKDRTGVTLINTRLISTVLSDVLLDRPLAIPGGLTLTLRRNQAGSYELVLQGRFRPFNLEFTITAETQSIGGGAALSMPAAAGNELIVPIPPGIVLPSVASTISLYYEIPIAVYEQEARRSRTRRSAGQLVTA